MTDDSKIAKEEKETNGASAKQEDPQQLFTDLCILSPRQKLPQQQQHAIALPPLNRSEVVHNLREALTDIVGYAHLTRYHFDVEAPCNHDNNLATTPTHPLPLISPFTGTNAAVTLRSVESLEEDAELGSALAHAVGFRIVLEPYHRLSITDHVARLRFLLAGHAPATRMLLEERKSDDDDDDTCSKKKEDKPLPVLNVPDSVAVDTTRLGDFFSLVWGSDTPHDPSVAVRWNQVEQAMNIPCTIVPSGYHPPPPQRTLMGDIAYYNVTLPDGALVSVTACRMGFYINGSKPGQLFDPTPAAEHCYAHALLDCLLQVSASLRDAWSKALENATERNKIVNQLSPFASTMYAGIRGNYPGFKTAALASATTTEAFLPASSWLVPVPQHFEKQPLAWNRHQYHPHDPHRSLVDDPPVSRDWNEELQTAREFPTTTLPERLERARMVYKIQYEFGEAALAAVLAIAQGQFMPMNPGERHPVYLHNNIFVSRGLDSGPETFKVARGDAACRKVANRDVQCIGTIQRMESHLATLATVVIDHLGMRYVCQSILPGILSGEKSHTLLYGAVDMSVPLVTDPTMHELLEDKVGKGMMLATRPVLCHPLADDGNNDNNNETAANSVPDEASPSQCISTCIPLDAKGILGSDQRRYLLDLNRLTPRDANWIPESDGGTGRIEGMEWDDEWAICVLRHELVSHFAQYKLSQRIAKRQKEKKSAEDEKGAITNEVETKDGKEQITNEVETKPEEVSSQALATPIEAESEQVTSALSPQDKEASTEEDSEAEKATKRLTEEDNEYMKTLRFNVNALLPYTKSFESESMDKEMIEQHKADEELIREISRFLWDLILPRITHSIRESHVSQGPFDGQSLTEFLHRNGVNCRYLGRLAVLAREQEEKDQKTNQSLRSGELTQLERRMMPTYWLDILECEMVARSAKHVLDSYLTEEGGTSQPAQTIASFLSALVSECDESAGQTENRLNKQPNTVPDDDDVGALTIADIVGSGTDVVSDSVRNRREIWNDIESDVTRRFRYKLLLFNKGTKSTRVLYTALLRRVCLRSGIRIVARNYELGGNCHCGGSNAADGRLTLSHPISPLDVVEVVAMMKHAAAYSEGFSHGYLGSNGNASVLPPLQVSLNEARATLERAHIHGSSRALGKALELAQEASTLYATVADHQAHPGVIESLELMAQVLFDAGEPATAALHQSKAIALIIQNGGVDSHAMIHAHGSMIHMLSSANATDEAAKHLRASAYLLEMLGGRSHSELYGVYLKLGTLYSTAGYGDQYLETALKYFQEAKRRGSADRLVDGCLPKNTARILEKLKRFKEAIEEEKQAFRVLQLFLGEKHKLTLESDENLKRQTKLAVENANKELAAAATSEILASTKDNGEDEKRKKKSKKKKGKGKATNGRS